MSFGRFHQENEVKTTVVSYVERSQLGSIESTTDQNRIILGDNSGLWLERWRLENAEILLDVESGVGAGRSII